MQIELNFGEYLKNIEKALKRETATEHTYRPALKELIESIKSKITATNEPKRVECGAPDFVITKGATPIGYIECKDIGKSLEPIEKDAFKKNPATGDGNQLKRYLEGLGNVILTNYLEFRWYVEGQLMLTVCLANIVKNQSIQTEKDSIENLGALLNEFLQSRTPTIKSPKELAERMSALARLIRELISNAFKQEDKGGSLHQQMEAFKEVLIHDLTTEQFADMYAQTICYGLFAARCSPSAIDRIDKGQPFTREQAAWDIPKTNPFLREVFSHICGPELDDRLIWIVDDLVELLARADIGGILEDFGKRTRQEDPVVHFYETFLSAYNPKLRKTRGVYYTPEPVVSYIVRSVDYILKEDFGIKDGLADTQKIPFYKSEIDAQGEIKREKAGECHKVLILDPAVGTGTFLYSVINQIYEHIQQKGQAGVWSDYVTKHLLPRIFGFELLIAPHAVAHMKLGIQLQEFGYDFQSNERLRIYLTNTLDEASKIPDFFFATIIAREAQSANEVKKDSPVYGYPR